MTTLLRLLLPLALLSALPVAAQTLTVHFLDVGQGDAALIRTAEGKTVLIDGGPPEAAKEFARRVDALTSGPIDLMILSHPHLDHYGGLMEVLERVGAKRYLEPGFEHNAPGYPELLTALQLKGVEIRISDRDTLTKNEPLVIDLGGGAKLTVLWPQRPLHPFLFDTRSDPNANSIVARLSYGDHSVLFTGDAEPETEAHFLRLGTDLRADVLKVGHHGSRFSSTTPFLQRIRPKLAVISCGKNNPYRHPGPDTLERLTAAGAQIKRTDLEGEIIVRLSSAGVTVQDSKQSQPTLVVKPVLSGGAKPGATPASGLRDTPTYIASKHSKTFHLSTCPAAAFIEKENAVHFTTRESAVAAKRPAKDCKP